MENDTQDVSSSDIPAVDYKSEKSKFTWFFHLPRILKGFGEQFSSNKVLPIASFVILTIGIGITVIASQQRQTTSQHASTTINPVYLGMYSDGFPYMNFTPTNVLPMQKLLNNHGLSIVMWYQGWVPSLSQDSTMGDPYNPLGNVFRPDLMDPVRTNGSIPMITWEPWHTGAGPSQSDFTLASIIGGQHDAVITAWAQASAQWKHPYFLRFAHEMNGSWYPWAAGVNGNSATDYQNAWIHVYTIFNNNHVNNVTWVWSPNTEYTGSTPLLSLYPGDQYVDWTGIDGYNWNTIKGGQWTDFANVIGPTYTVIQNISKKPLVIAETGSVECPTASCPHDALQKTSNRPDWITQGFGQDLPGGLFKNIKAVVWWNQVYKQTNSDQTADFTLNALGASQNAFIKAIGNPYYGSNVFGYQSFQDNSKIGPLPPILQAGPPIPIQATPAPPSGPVGVSPVSGPICAGGAGRCYINNSCPGGANTQVSASDCNPAKTSTGIPYRICCLSVPKAPPKPIYPAQIKPGYPECSTPHTGCGYIGDGHLVWVTPLGWGRYDCQNLGLTPDCACHNHKGVKDTSNNPNLPNNPYDQCSQPFGNQSQCPYDANVHDFFKIYVCNDGTYACLNQGQVAGKCGINQSFQ